MTRDAARRTFEHDGLALSYLDTGGDGPVLLALHGHLNEGRFIDQGAVPADLPYRIIAPDQRGHGESEHADSYEVGDYVGDALALLDHLGVDRVAVLGHSLGGVVAYSLAAAAPERVDRLVVVDIGAENEGDLAITATWPRRAASRAELVEAFSFMGANQAYVMREHPDGWGVPWDADEMIASQRAMNGDRWADWTATSMPALLVHGTASTALTGSLARRMIAARPGTGLLELEGGHAVYVDAPEAYALGVGTFLRH